MSFFDSLNQYSSLILVAITAVYAFLTWRMVLELRHAREAESEPYLIAALVPFGALNVKVRIHNAGRGPALQIEASIKLLPSDGTAESTWRHPALLPGAFEDLKLPVKQFSLKEIVEKHESLQIDMTWTNAFRRQRTEIFRYNLLSQMQGWYESGQLIGPEEIPVQLQKIQKELSKIRGSLESENRERSTSRLIRRYRRERLPWNRFFQWLRSILRISSK